MRSPRKAIEACIQRSHFFGGSFQDDSAYSSASQPARVDTQVLGAQTHAGRSIGAGLQCGGSMEIRPLPSKARLPGALRPSNQADEERTDPIDFGSAETFDPSTISVGPSDDPGPQALRTTLLQLCLGNEANACYLNTVLMAELWARCMDSHFSRKDTGDWLRPLHRLLSQRSSTQRIVDPDCLGHLLARRFDFHAKGVQHDATYRLLDGRFVSNP